MVCYIQVKELGNPKNKKGKDSPPHVDICETVRPIIENGDELPLPLLCRLIKFKILWLKQNDMQRIAAEKKVTMFLVLFLYIACLMACLCGCLSKVYIRHIIILTECRW